MYFECELIGLCVLNCKPKYDIISEYKLSDNENVGILDSVMIKREFRGSKLQKQIIEYIDSSDPADLCMFCLVLFFVLIGFVAYGIKELFKK